MILNNYDKIKGLLKFSDGRDIFYFIQVLQRRKDIPELESDCVKLWSRLVCSESGFKQAFEQCKRLCDTFGGRVYISLEPRSLKKFSKACLREIADIVCSEDYRRVLKFRDSCAQSDKISGAKEVGTCRRWIIDLDNDKDWGKSYEEILREIESMCRILSNVLDTVPTLHGNHIIVEAQNDLRVKVNSYAKEDIVKMEANTILYANTEVK